MVGPGLRLKHDHRHADGSPDPVTMYGGESRSAGTAVRQEFPVDAESVALFEREGLEASVTNTWAMEIEPGKRFLYELSRPGGRLFQVEFDLANPVDLPPAPWGSDSIAASSSSSSTGVSKVITGSSYSPGSSTAISALEGERRFSSTVLTAIRCNQVEKLARASNLGSAFHALMNASWQQSAARSGLRVMRRQSPCTRPT